MKNQILPILVLSILLFGCTTTPTLENPTQTPFPATQTPMPTASSTSTTTEQVVQTADLSGFASAWSSHDDSEIRALYTEDARYFTENEIMHLTLQQPIQVKVTEDAFEEAVEKYEGFQLRILGSPILIFDKLVAFAYRWEKGTSGYSGMSLLRYEGDKIFLQVDITSDQATNNDVESAPPLSNTSQLDLLMEAWNQADLETASGLYRQNPLIVSDEDLAQAPWRDHSFPVGIDNLLPQFTGWNPSIISQPIQLENMVIFAWRWYDKSFPIGYGIRLLRFDGGVIGSDIRFVIRPWEASGKAFMTP